MAVTASTAERDYGAGTITIRPTLTIDRRALGRHSYNLRVIKTLIVTTHERHWHLLLSRTVTSVHEVKRTTMGDPNEIA